MDHMSVTKKKLTCGDLDRFKNSFHQLPYFALKAHHIQSIPSKDISATPSDFHSFLCQAIHKAKHRILLASLYIGPAATAAATATATAAAAAAAATVVSGGKEDENTSFANKCEKELLITLQKAAQNEDGPRIQILMDASRGLRPVGNTCSAQAVYNHITLPTTPTLDHNNTSSKNKVFLFPVLHSLLQSYIPSPLDEVVGVFHIKAYVMDDQLILTGANLSEEYFTDRQDRYLIFNQGANGFVDFYAHLFDILSHYAYEYTPDEPQVSYNTSFSTHTTTYDTFTTNTKREHLAHALSNLFQRYTNNNNNIYKQIDEEKNDSIVAYAIPTFQAPKAFFNNHTSHLSFPMDSTLIQQWLKEILQHDSSTTIRLASAYLNPTPNFLSVLTQFGSTYNHHNSSSRHGLENVNNTNFTTTTATTTATNTSNTPGKVILLTAGTTSHGFAPKKNKRGEGKDRSWVPTAFHHILDEISSFIFPRGGNIILYERQGWTFHAKGLWITTTNEKYDNTNHIHSLHSDPSKYCIMKPESTLLGTVVGSGNFGYRSETLDFESNTILLMNRKNHSNERVKTAQLLVQDWNALCHHVTPFQSTNKSSPKTKRHESFSVYYKNSIKRLGLQAIVRFGRIFF